MRIYEYHIMRNLRVSYGIYKPPPDQSDRSICYNYDLIILVVWKPYRSKEKLLLQIPYCTQL